MLYVLHNDYIVFHFRFIDPPVFFTPNFLWSRRENDPKGAKGFLVPLHHGKPHFPPFFDFLRVKSKVLHPWVYSSICSSVPPSMIRPLIRFAPDQTVAVALCLACSLFPSSFSLFSIFYFISSFPSLQDPSYCIFFLFYSQNSRWHALCCARPHRGPADCLPLSLRGSNFHKCSTSGL